jgi:hypothetical protein
MPSDDDLLLEFADSEAAIAEARAAIAKWGDAFRCQLVMAQHLEHWAAYLEELRAGGQMEGVRLDRTGRIATPDYWDGYIQAIRHMADNLRAGDYLPGGRSFDDTVEGRAF